MSMSVMWQNVIRVVPGKELICGCYLNVSNIACCKNAISALEFIVSVHEGVEEIILNGGKWEI